MIVRTSKGYQVKSESGDKNLSKPNISKKKAKKRVRQVEYYKAKAEGALKG
jgi:hypothetical protein